MQRKIWVKRPGASSTRVEVSEDDLVDNVRDAILLKYANSLGRNIDSPDITLKIVAREQANKNVPVERALGPEESIGGTLDTYYPGGQTIEEALLIEVATRRSPRPSPRPGQYHIGSYQHGIYPPDETDKSYFDSMALRSPGGPYAAFPQQRTHQGLAPHPAMNILATGQPPPFPSPGGAQSLGRGRYNTGSNPVRRQISSPTIIHTHPSTSNLAEPKSHLNGIPSASTIPTSPGPTPMEKPSITPPNRPPSPHQHQKDRTGGKKNVKGRTGQNLEISALSAQSASNSLLDGTVPPINVLIVEDNPINLKLLEQFMKRLKVRWKSAINGREAVNTWKTGGFHLVMMDIQLPVMNGLDATREIRRLEAVNGIGVFGGSPIDGDSKKSTCASENPEGDDKLSDRSLFKSPVIIVALTASSLQSDRHEALAAGCNDFLTKPVGFVWMERKVTEWGCMQALIDYDGWRKWKEYAKPKKDQDPATRAQEEKEAKAKEKAALRAAFLRPPPGTTRNSKQDTDLSKTSNLGPPKDIKTIDSSNSATKKDNPEEKKSIPPPITRTMSGPKQATNSTTSSNGNSNSSTSKASPKSAASTAGPIPGSPLMSPSIPASSIPSPPIQNGLHKISSRSSGSSSAVTTSSPLAAPPLRSQKTIRSGSNSAFNQLGSTLEVDESSA